MQKIQKKKKLNSIYCEAPHPHVRHVSIDISWRLQDKLLVKLCPLEGREGFATKILYKVA